MIYAMILLKNVALDGFLLFNFFILNFFSTTLSKGKLIRYDGSFLGKKKKKIVLNDIFYGN